MNLRFALFVILIIVLTGSYAYAVAEPFRADSSKSIIVSLDSLSESDFALLELYKDSFLNEVKEIKSVILRNKKRQLDTTVALMNRSSHMEIGLDFASRVLSNGRDAGVKGVVFYPSVMYYHKTGLYAALSMGFYTDSTVRHSAKIPLISFSPGFYRRLFKIWTLNIAYSRSFILYGNQFQRGLLNNSLVLYNNFDILNYLSISVRAGISWSSNLTSRKTLPNRRVTYRLLTKKLDQSYTADLQVSLRKDFHFYNFIGSKVFTLSPEVLFLFGRDNATFLQQQFITGKNQQVDSSYRLAYDKLFGFLDLEPGLTADWRIRNLEIYASFHCAIPFNEFVQEGNVSGRITNPHHYYPYAEAGIKYLFRIIPFRKKRAEKLNAK